MKILNSKTLKNKSKQYLVKVSEDKYGVQGSYFIRYYTTMEEAKQDYDGEKRII